MEYRFIPSVYPQFYLEIQDVITSHPVLRCFGRELLNIVGQSDKVLMSDMKETVTISYGPDKVVQTSKIGITAWGGVSVTRMESSPIRVAILIAQREDPKNIEDFLYIARGLVWLSLPAACQELLGYGNPLY